METIETHGVAIGVKDRDTGAKPSSSMSRRSNREQCPTGIIALKGIERATGCSDSLSV